ncbi:hypothetical protein BHM03_00010728 [Ensete ventricosum]|nr:hypothetical protein BHM03_00010728 [Ensete ventricosum]
MNFTEVDWVKQTLKRSVFFCFISFLQLATTVASLCTSNKEASPGWDTLMKVGCKLGESRIILCEEGTKHRLQKLQLNFPRLASVA